MFGVVFLLFSMIIGIASMVQKHNDKHEWNKDGKEWAIKNGRSAYLDAGGMWRDIKTGEGYYYKIDENGDRWKIEAYTDKPIENVSETKRKKYEAENKAKAGNSRFYVRSVGMPDPNRNYTKGKRMDVQRRDHLTRVVDSITGQEYFRAQRGDVYLYQNLDTGMFDYIEPKKNDPRLEVYGEKDFIRIDNKPENLDFYRKSENKRKEKMIQDGFEWYHDINRAMELYSGIWG